MVLNGISVHITVGEQTEQGKEFPYMGFRIAEDANYEAEIKSKLGLEMTLLGKLQKIWKSINISIPTKA